MPWKTFDYSDALSRANSCYPQLSNDLGTVVFQKYDKEWNEWIDLHEGNEIEDRAKIHGVLVAQLTDICSESEVGN